MTGREFYHDCIWINNTLLVNVMFSCFLASVLAFVKEILTGPFSFFFGRNSSHTRDGRTFPVEVLHGFV